MKNDVHYEILRGALEKITERLNELKSEGRDLTVDVTPDGDNVIAVINFKVEN